MWDVFVLLQGMKNQEMSTSSQKGGFRAERVGKGQQ